MRALHNLNRTRTCLKTSRCCGTTRGGAAWRQRHPRAHALGDRRRRARTHAPLPLPARWFDPAVTDPRPTSMAGEPLGRAPAVEPPETLAPPPPPAARPPACRPMTRRRRPKPTSKHGQGGRDGADGAEVGSGVTTPRAPWAGDPLGRVHLEPPTTTASPPPPTPPARPPRRVPATWSEPTAAHRPPPTPRPTLCSEPRCSDTRAVPPAPSRASPLCSAPRVALPPRASPAAPPRAPRPAPNRMPPPVPAHIRLLLRHARRPPHSIPRVAPLLCPRVALPPRAAPAVPSRAPRPAPNRALPPAPASTHAPPSRSIPRIAPDERRAPCPACPTNTFARPPARHAMAGQAARPRPTCVRAATCNAFNPP
jgi:hypothetical protein